MSLQSELNQLFTRDDDDDGFDENESSLNDIIQGGHTPYITERTKHSFDFSIPPYAIRTSTPVVLDTINEEREDSLSSAYHASNISPSRDSSSSVSTKEPRGSLSSHASSIPVTPQSTVSASPTTNYLYNPNILFPRTSPAKGRATVSIDSSLPSRQLSPAHSTTGRSSVNVLLSSPTTSYPQVYGRRSQPYQNTDRIPITPLIPPVQYRAKTVLVKRGSVQVVKKAQEEYDEQIRAHADDFYNQIPLPRGDESKEELLDIIFQLNKKNVELASQLEEYSNTLQKVDKYVFQKEEECKRWKNRYTSLLAHN
ncbi:hypothetical protein WA158_005209 [Blastocystis sp. Blastoise]